MLKGIDVAKWQKTINWQKVKGAGVQFAILKAIDKTNQKEPALERNYKGATEQGIPVGVYNYLYAITVQEAIVAANAVLAAIQDKKIPCRVWLDVEDKCLMNKGIQLIRIINAYQKTITDAGYEFGVYTGLSFYNSYIKPYKNEVSCDFWIARYPSSKTMYMTDFPSASKKPGIAHNLWGWQYSSKGKVAGIAGNVDLDLCYVSIQGGTVRSDTQYYPRYAGSSASIVSALNAIGIDSSYAYRKLIAKANGIAGYAGTPKQNTDMLARLKNGTLKRPC